ncbi:MAG: J domain-containing protein [Verrucomicrobiota bacterium]|nr:J domain-containing protein [Verrucomicrobiota bacterium]
MATGFKDYYKILGVTATASTEEIQKAFRKLARLYHPDVTKNKATGEAKFKEINEAYHVLRDPEQRKRYDELGANWQDQPYSPPQRRRAPTTGSPRTRRGASQSADDFYEYGGTGYSDFFESFFGNQGSGFKRHSPTVDSDDDGFVERGEDFETDLVITLEEAVHGSQRTLTMRHPGDGLAEDSTTSFQVRIPPGMREGMKIRVTGKGHPGTGSGANGDLYLRISYAHHPDFTVKGADLYCDLDVAPWEAVLGAKVNLPTLDGVKSLTIPAGTTTDDQLRLRGLGLPVDKTSRGNLHVIVKIQLPKTITPAQKALWEKLEKESASFKPRDVS